MTRIPSREQIKQIRNESRGKKQGNLQYKIISSFGWMDGLRCPVPTCSPEKLPKAAPDICVQVLGCPRLSHTPAHLCLGRGGRKRSSPSGGSAYGILRQRSTFTSAVTNELPYYIRTCFPVSLSVLSPLTRPLEVSMTSCSTWSGCRSRLAATDSQQTATQQTPAYRIITACRSSATSRDIFINPDWEA